MTRAESKRLGRVADLGCAICRRIGYPGTPAEIHHRRTGTGMGRRASHADVAPLCAYHHRGEEGFHGLGRRAFEALHGVTELELIAETRRLLGEAA